MFTHTIRNNLRAWRDDKETRWTVTADPFSNRILFATDKGTLIFAYRLSRWSYSTHCGAYCAVLPLPNILEANINPRENIPQNAVNYRRGAYSLSYLNYNCLYNESGQNEEARINTGWTSSGDGSSCVDINRIYHRCDGNDALFTTLQYSLNRDYLRNIFQTSQKASSNDGRFSFRVRARFYRLIIGFAKGASWSKDNHTTAAKDALKAYKDGYGGQVYQGQRVADLDPTTTQGVNATGKNLSNYQNYEKNALGDYGNTKSYAEQNLGGLASQDPSKMNGLQQQGLVNALQYAKEQANQSLNAEGMQGGSQAATTLARSLGQTAGDAYAHAYQDNVGNKISATEAMDNGAQNRQSLIGNIVGTGNNLADQAITGGKVNQQQSQNKINADINKFSEQQSAPYSAISALNSATEGADSGYSNSVTKSNPGILGTIGGIGSAAQSLAGAATGFAGL